MLLAEYRIARFLVEDASETLHRLLEQKADKPYINATQKRLDRAMERLVNLTQNATVEERQDVSTYLAGEA